MTAVRQFLPDPPAGQPPPASARQRLGLVLIVLGLAGILWGVFHVLGGIGGYEGRDFAHRKSDYQVRTVVHETFPGALVRALAGLALVLVGGQLRRPAAPPR
jgi:hypothetical protein